MPRLTLAYRDYSELPHEVVRRFAGQLTELDLSHNRFSALQSLAGLAQLETLVLDNNAIATHVAFPHLPNLHTLWLNHNVVDNLALFIASVRCKEERESEGHVWMGRERGQTVYRTACRLLVFPLYSLYRPIPACNYLLWLCEKEKKR